ncbi:MAG: cytochrome c3 family protein [Proteobacteria bacterium]|nr:cytochrome c3 family protein [Pseudomonadota bacterium]
MRRVFIIYSIAAAILGVGLVQGGETEDLSSVLLPAGQPSVFGAHDRCDARKKGCVTCHPKATKSRWASERLVPNMEICAECHEAARNVTIATPVTGDCLTCHREVKKGERPVRGDYPRPNVRFSHAAHQTEIKCRACHPKAAANQPTGTELDIPSMRQCYSCHTKGKGSTKCRTCHLVHKDGRLVTDFGGQKLKPPSWLKGPTHRMEWVGRHAAKAGADSGFCSACHRESFCQDCHTGRLRPRNVHPGDWMTTHGVSTRIDNPRCRGCHRKQSFCITCHRRSGVAPDSPAGSRPKGGLGRYHRGMENAQLMRRAKYDITSCVSCHSEGSCISCHRAKFNPHPPGFSRKCKKLAVRNRRACAKCHRDDALKRCK